MSFFLLLLHRVFLFPRFIVLFYPVENVRYSSWVPARRFAVVVLAVLHEVVMVTGLLGRDAAGRIVD